MVLCLLDLKLCLEVADVGKTKKVVMTTSEGVQYSCGVPLRKEEATELDQTEEEVSEVCFGYTKVILDLKEDSNEDSI